MSGDSLSAANFREFAKKIISKYADKGLILDSMMWGQIIAYYDAKLEANERELKAAEETYKEILSLLETVKKYMPDEAREGIQTVLDQG